MAGIEKIRIMKRKTPISEVKRYLGAPFEKMVKFVVDIEREIIAMGGEMHADAEAILLEDGSRQENIWGANLYPLQDRETRIEFTSLINIRPSVDNLSLEIMSPEIRNKVQTIVEDLIQFADE
jgi:hypothetical protein